MAEEEEEALGRDGRARRRRAIDNGINPGARRSWGGEGGELLPLRDDRRMAGAAGGRELVVGAGSTAWIRGAGSSSFSELVLLHAQPIQEKKVHVFIFAVSIAVYVGLQPAALVCFAGERVAVVFVWHVVRRLVCGQRLSFRGV